MSQKSSIRHDLDAKGELLIWTDVDPAYEQDFNDWYDLEHMQERAAIPGFTWSRRYVSANVPGKYLALYRTETLHVFNSENYQLAFQNQTAWSMRNFTRMQNSVRRVNAVTEVHGTGTGAAVALIFLETLAQAEYCLERAIELQKTVSGVVGQKILTPNASLSTPLPSETPGSRPMMPFLIIDTSSIEAAHQAGKTLTNWLGLSDSAFKCFTLLWDLQSSSLQKSSSLK